MVDPASTPLGRMLLEEITPVVMVLSTPLAEESCRKNGLSFIQMLTPFCTFNNIDVPVRTASDQPYRLQKFKLRLFYASDVRQPNMEVAKQHIKDVITQGGEERFSELSSDVPESCDIHASSGPDKIPSWFQFFNKNLIRMVSFSDHEAFDHPVACLLVVSSKDELPVNRFVDLFNTNKLPSLLNNGAMDPKITKHYLLLHDNQDGPPDRGTKILADMKSMFGSSDCMLLHINSAHELPVQHQDNPWASHVSVNNAFDASTNETLGSCLNPDDINEIKDLMHEFSSKHIIPNMEQKIRVLNQQISATRKGFRNQIKNLWWRKGKEDSVDSNGSMYTFNSIESQIRVLGDYAFMLRDYDLALSNYRLISTDYKLDKSWKRYAGVQEVMGLTYFMLDQSKKEAEYCMENAFNTYLKLGFSGQQNATRCGLWWVEMLKARDEYKEAATVYFRLCSEDLLHSAVMLEQASYCYLLSKPSMLRKLGFHLVLSGDYYKKCDQIKHAIRAYRGAVSVFKGTTWNHIRDHVHFHIGQWYALLGMYDIAVKHMLEILACSHQSMAKQELFLSHSLQIVERTGKTFEILKLMLPGINISSLKVISEDHRTYASPTAAGIRESMWRSLEEEMIPSFSTAKTNWLELHSKLISKKPHESNVCVAGESVKVDIEFRNPLQIPISVTGISLICSLSPKTNETTTSDEKKSDEENENEDDSLRTSRDSDTNYSSFILSEVDFSLGGGETTVVQLTVTPIIEGILQIVGVKWKLSGSLVGIYNFEPNGAKKSITKNRRKQKHSPRDNLKFTVIKNIPKLQGSIHSFPERLFAGDVRKLVLELRNQSDCPIKNLKMKISNSRLLNVGNRYSVNSEFPACLEKIAASEKIDGDINADNSSQSVFLFPEDTSIQGDTTFLWPLWLRAAVPGNISLYVSIYYEMGDTSSIIKYRTLRMQYDLQILPSLDVSFHINPSPLRLQEFLVRMDVVNRTSSESFIVHQLSSFGQQWEISLLQPPESIFPSKSLMAGQALSCFLMLKNRMDSLTSKDKKSAISSLLASDVRLVPHGSQDPLYDINKSPLIDFQNHERMLQKSSDKGDLSTVDFMLISRPLKIESKPEFSEPPHLFSYHACHCSTSSTGPISWLVEGPATLQHNFSVTFCEVKLNMTLYNSSDAIACVHIKTSDSSGIDHTGSVTTVQSGSPSNQVGWHDISLTNDSKITSNVAEPQLLKSVSLDSVSPFIWSGSSSTSVKIEPMSSLEIPLQICVFHPGTFDLSNYSMHWNLVPSNNDKGNCEDGRQSSGTCQGYPYYLTVLQSD